MFEICYKSGDGRRLAYSGERMETREQAEIVLAFLDNPENMHIVEVSDDVLVAVKHE